MDNLTAHSSTKYDQEVGNTIPYYNCFHEETIGLLKASDKKISSWIDTGCGTGTLVDRSYAEFANTTFFLTDPSEAMLKIAKDKLKEYSRVKILDPMPTQALPAHVKEKVDVVTAIQCHHYLSIEERKKATMACWEILKEDGIYITYENIRPFTDEGCKIGQDKWMNFQLSRGKDSQSITKHLERFDKEYFPITVDEHLKLMRESGFRVVELLWYSCMQAGFYCIK